MRESRISDHGEVAPASSALISPRPVSDALCSGLLVEVNSVDEKTPFVFLAVFSSRITSVAILPSVQPTNHLKQC